MGLNQEIADLRRRLYELERRVSGQPPTAPPRPELGEITSASPFRVTLTDGMVIEPATLFGGAPAVSGPALIVYPDDAPPVAILEGGAGAEVLDDLTDVSILSPSNGDVLTFNGSDWINASLELDDLSDVASTSPSTGDVLTWNGSQWVNQIVSAPSMLAATSVSTTGTLLNNSSVGFVSLASTSISVVSGQRYYAIGTFTGEMLSYGFAGGWTFDLSLDIGSTSFYGSETGPGQFENTYSNKTFRSLSASGVITATSTGIMTVGMRGSMSGGGTTWRAVNPTIAVWKAT